MANLRFYRTKRVSPLINEKHPAKQPMILYYSIHHCADNNIQQSFLTDLFADYKTNLFPAAVSPDIELFLKNTNLTQD